MYYIYYYVSNKNDEYNRYRVSRFCMAFNYQVRGLNLVLHFIQNVVNLNEKCIMYFKKT